MFAKQTVADPKLTKNVTQLLSGLRAPSRVTVKVNRGEVTLSGTLQYEHQRQKAMQAARGVSGVRNVVDRMQVLPAPRRV